MNTLEPAYRYASHRVKVILTDTEGKTYIDLFAGIATNVLGYNHPVLTEALHNQIAKVIHTSNVFYVEGQVTWPKAVNSSAVVRCSLATLVKLMKVLLARRY